METSIFTVTENGLEYNGEIISPFWPKVEKVRTIVRIGEEGKEQREYRISICMSDGKKLPAYTLSRIDKIRYFDIWPECEDAELSANDKKLLYLYMQKQIKNAENQEVLLFDRTGYQKGSFTFGKRMVITENPKNNVVLETVEKLPEFARKYSERKNFIEYICQMNSLYSGVSEILFIIRLAAMMKPIFEKAGCPLKCFLNLYGRSGAGKTSLAQLFFSQISDQTVNFKTVRKKTLENEMQRFSGHTVLVDDYHPEPVTNDRLQQAGKLDLIARMSDDPGAALAVITAEQLDGGFSVQDRMLQIETNRKMSNWDLFNDLNANRGCYIDFLYDFANTIYTNTGRYVELIRKENEGAESSVTRSEFRISNNIAILRICVKIFCQLYLKEEEKGQLERTLKVEDYYSYMCSLLQNIEERQRAHMNTVMDLETGVDWAIRLHEMLNQGEFELLFNSKDFSGRNNSRPTALFDNNRYYISRWSLKTAIEKHYGRQIPLKSVVDDLLEKEILCTDRTASNTKKKDGAYYYVIDYKALQFYYNKKG